MLKAIIFDYDETLVKTLESRIEAYIGLAKNRYNLELTETMIRKSFGLPYEDFIRSLFGNVDDVENIIKNYQEISLNYPNKVYEGAVECVNKLIGHYQIGILSGSRRKMMMEDLTRLGFPVGRFFYIQTGEDTNVHKPNPEVFKPLLNLLSEKKIGPNKVVYIGDDMRDFEASSKAGLHYIALANHTTDRSVFLTNKVPFTLTFEELPAKINELIK